MVDVVFLRYVTTRLGLEHAHACLALTGMVSHALVRRTLPVPSRVLSAVDIAFIFFVSRLAFDVVFSAVNPCVTGNGGCDVGAATCVFLYGSRFCRCMRGYHGNGTACYDVNE